MITDKSRTRNDDIVDMQLSLAHLTGKHTISINFKRRTCDIKPGVYFLFDKNMHIIYVGQSLDPMKRIFQNGIRFCRLVVMPIDKEHLKLVESAFIIFLKPKFNMKTEIPLSKFNLNPKIVCEDAIAGKYYKGNSKKYNFNGMEYQKFNFKIVNA